MNPGVLASAAWYCDGCLLEMSAMLEPQAFKISEGWSGLSAYHISVCSGGAIEMLRGCQQC